MGNQKTKDYTEPENELEKDSKKTTQKLKTDSQTKKVIKPKKGKTKIRSARYKKFKKQIENKKYSIKKALKLVLETSNKKFKSSIELHLNLNIDSSKSDQNIRFFTTLPQKVERNFNILAITSQPEKAKKAGAKWAGKSEIIKKLQKGEIKPNILIAEPKFMKDLSKLAKILGPKGLMPNPKNNTLTENLVNEIKEYQNGKIEVKSDSTGNLHFVIGKNDWQILNLEKNFEHLLSDVRAHKPQAVKKEFVKSASICSTMSPSIKVKI
jgi:large subunit ribosomal protein L1